MGIAPAFLMNDSPFNVFSGLEDDCYRMVEVVVSSLSGARGRLFESLTLPAGSRIICVVRDGLPLVDFDLIFLREGDKVVALTDDPSAMHRLFSL